MSRGYTVIEVLVVLLLMGLAAALVAPAFVQHDERGALVTLIGEARRTAIHRAEGMALRIERSGAWRLDGLASTEAGAIAMGTLSPAPPLAVTLLFSPLGTCAPDVETARDAEALQLNPLLCERTR